MNELAPIQQYLDVSLPVALWILLNIMMELSKKIPRFPKWLIPFFSVATGAIVYPFISDQSKVGFGVRYPIIAEIITGAFAGGMAVATHQQFILISRKMFGNRCFSTGDTEVFTKPDVKP